MNLSQQRLAENIRERLAASGVPQDRFERPGFRDAFHLAEEISKEGSAVVVMRDFDLKKFCESSLAFVCSLPQATRHKWFRVFTRTLFLVGNPLKLRDRFHFDYIVNDGSIGWIGPTFPDATLTIRRLLSSFYFDIFPLGPPEFDLIVPSKDFSGKTWLLYFAVAGLTGPQCIVHLNHTLAEGVIVGLFRVGDRIRVRTVPSLSAGSCANLASLRVHVDPYDETRLRGYTGIASLPQEAIE